MHGQFCLSFGLVPSQFSLYRVWLICSWNETCMTFQMIHHHTLLLLLCSLWTHNVFVYVELTYQNEFSKQLYAFCENIFHSILDHIYSDDELQTHLQEIQKELTVEKRATSAFISKKRTAKDDRPSATYTGYLLGVSVLVGVPLLIVIPDVSRALNYLYRNKTIVWQRVMDLISAKR